MCLNLEVLIVSIQVNSLIQLSESGPILHFSPANGYPAMAYRAMLEPFRESNMVVASVHRPLWKPEVKPESVASWEVFAEDIINAAEKLNSPMTSIGHSMGASALLIAASRRPELFRSLILIEPVLVPRAAALMLKFCSVLFPNKIPLVGKTLARVDCWASKQAAFDHFRPKYVFENIDDKELWDYVNHGVVESADGSCKLAFSKAWEARCYTLVYDLWPIIERVQVPILVIRGENSNTLSSSVWQKLKKVSPQFELKEIAGAGHLLPFEQPETMVSEIQNWLDNH
jgi:pimeloyl-ACP methyl ester carboxylesterase